MVPKDGKLDTRFWISVSGLLLAIIGTFVSTTRSIERNTTNITRTREEVQCLRHEIQRVQDVQHEMMMELRK